MLIFMEVERNEKNVQGNLKRRIRSPKRFHTSASAILHVGIFSKEILLNDRKI